MYWTRSKLTSPTLTSNSQQNSYVLNFKKPIPAETSCKTFQSSYKMPKTNVYTYILKSLILKPGRGNTLPFPPLPLSFTVVLDHPKAEVLPTCFDSQSGPVPDNIPASFRSQVKESATDSGSSSSPLTGSFKVDRWLRVVLR